MAKRHLVPGFYIAECDLLRPLYKVGHTGDLRERLHDSAYVTCFPPNSWRFVATLELPTKEAAAEVECGVLVHFQKNRLGSSELVQVTLAELLNLAQKLVELLSYPLILKRAPVYERPAAPKSKTLAKTKTEPMVAKMKLLLETALAPLVPANYPDSLPTSVSEEDAADELNLIEAELTSDKLVLREYQQEAATAITAELTKNRRAILQMACRCGKTPVAFTTAQMIGLPVLFLVPGLALLRQTAQKIYHYAGGRINLLLVGSDQQEVKLKNCSLGMTTNDQVIMAFMQKTVDSKFPNWVISTYQSSALLTPHIKEFGLTFTKRTGQTFAGHLGTSNQTLEIWYAINNSASAISAATLSIFYNNTFDDQAVIVASVSGCYMTAPWSTVGPYVNYQLNSTATQATNTYSTSFANSLAIEFHGTNDPYALGYVTTSGWSGVNFIQNGGATYWEYVFLSSRGLTSLQTNSTTTTSGTASASWISIVDSLVS